MNGVVYSTVHEGGDIDARDVSQYDAYRRRS
jgi:hypothetical protein